MDRELLLTIRIKCGEPLVVRGQTRDIVMIPFSGTASGERFSGSVAPGAVDTQKIPKGGEAFLSARYILHGKDSAGNECQVFIENQGNPAEGLTPAIVTDSPALADWETSALTSGLEGIPEGVLVRIFRQNRPEA